MTVCWETLRVEAPLGRCPKGSSLHFQGGRSILTAPTGSVDAHHFLFVFRQERLLRLHGSISGDQLISFLPPPPPPTAPGTDLGMNAKQCHLLLFSCAFLEKEAWCPLFEFCDLCKCMPAYSILLQRWMWKPTWCRRKMRDPPKFPLVLAWWCRYKEATWCFQRVYLCNSQVLRSLCFPFSKMGRIWEFQSSGLESALSLPRAQVRSLVRELRPHKPWGMAKKKKMGKM